MCLVVLISVNTQSLWGISSVGRAPALHAGGQEFEPPILQNYLKSRQGSFLMPFSYSIILKSFDF